MNKILIDEAVAKFALWRLEDIKDYMGHRWDEDDEQNLVALRQSLEQPAPAQPLTDARIEEIAARTLFPVNFARAIEAAHGITSGKATEKGGAA